MRKVFYSKVESDDVKPDNFEIEECLWFDPEEPLPKPYSYRLPELLEKFKKSLVR